MPLSDYLQHYLKNLIDCVFFLEDSTEPSVLFNLDSFLSVAAAQISYWNFFIIHFWIDPLFPWTHIAPPFLVPFFVLLDYILK